MEVDIKHYENLANAIIAQAANDYRRALKTIKKRPNDIYANRDILECRRFFRSPFFRSLTTVDGEWLMKQIEEAPEIERSRKLYYTL